MSQAKRFRELINNTFEISQTIDGVKTIYVSGDDTKLYVNKHFGNAYCYYDNTTDLKADFDHFNRLHVTDFIRLLKALQFEYNPCENFDKYSEITVNHTGTIGNINNSTVTSKVNAFDSDTLVTDAENVANGGNTTTLNNSDGTIEHTHGNIGVQTVSNMILQNGTGEAYLRFNSFVEHYINRWVSGCIVGYGSEENEIEFSKDTEYTTKTEFDNLSNDVVNIADTVASHTESINTLGNSLGSVIEDLEDVSESVEDHETKIETLENQLTANNLPIYLDYHGGKYGYNTSPTRGADTFTPFSTSATYSELLGRIITYNSTVKTYTASRDGILDITDVWNGTNNRPTIKVNGVTKTISWTVYANIGNTSLCIQGSIPGIQEGDTIEIITQTGVNFDVVTLFIK